MVSTDATQRLHIKSFFGISIADAMEQARREFGPDALLLNTRETPIEARHLGRYEAVFGYSPAPAAPPAPPSQPRAADDLRRRLDEIRELVARISPPREAIDPGGAVERGLVEAGVETGLAREIEQAVRQRINRQTVREIDRPRLAPPVAPEALLSETVAEMKSRCEAAPEIGRITALVGPPGAGKTTTLVKLAVAQGLAQRRAVSLISIDTQRIAGADQLRTYAAILGVPFQAVESTGALEQAIDASPAGALILIDTPGYSPALLQDLGAELAGFFSHRQDIDTHLILTASQRLADMRAAAERFAIFGPGKLLFTRLDETSSFAAVFCEAARSGKPLSFFGGGQAVPEDLEPASPMRVIESLVSQLPESLRAVA